MPLFPEGGDLGKEECMRRKKRFAAAWLCLAVISALAAALPCAGRAGAGEGPAGQALEQRAVEVTRVKNDFLRRVLNDKAIPYQIDAKGAVVAVRVGGEWAAVAKIDIVPLVPAGGGSANPTAHEITFFTDRGIYRLVSSIAAR